MCNFFDVHTVLFYFIFIFFEQNDLLLKKNNVINFTQN